MVAEFSMRLQNVNNLSGGCLGMCLEPAPFVIEIQRAVPGPYNFATVFTFPGIFRGSGNARKQIIPIAQLCNSDPKANIRLIYRNC